MHIKSRYTVICVHLVKVCSLFINLRCEAMTGSHCRTYVLIMSTCALCNQMQAWDDRTHTASVTASCNQGHNDVSFCLRGIRWWTVVNTNDCWRISAISESSDYFIAEEKRFVMWINLCVSGDKYVKPCLCVQLISPELNSYKQVFFHLCDLHVVGISVLNSDCLWSTVGIITWVT